MTTGVALFGGTFNPIHAGHLRAAEEVFTALNLRKIIFVPSATPPHKSEQPLASAEQRYRWVKQATAPHPGFSVDTLELDRQGPSYTVDTLRQFRKTLAPERPVFLLGWDAFCLLDTWHEAEQIPALADLVVLTRPPEKEKHFEEERLPALFSGHVRLEDEGRLLRHDLHGGTDPEGWVRLLPIAALEVSASQIRERLRKGESVRYLLPDSILRDVEESNIYSSLST